MELKLEKGKEYSVTHKRKGFFRGVLLDVLSAPRDDLQDSRFLTFEIDVSEGSGSEWLRRAKNPGKAKHIEKQVSNIRPSLVTHIQLSSRSPKLPESAEKGAEVGQEVAQQESLFDRIKTFLGGGISD